MDLKRLPDFVLIHKANTAQTKMLQAMIDQELDRRYQEVKEELEEYEVFENV